MTDARFPERWLNDRRVTRLSDAAFRLFVTALTWSVSNRTDGVLYDDDLELMPAVDAAAVTELAKAGLVCRLKDFWALVGFTDTQTTSAELVEMAHKRAAERDKKARQRAHGRGDHSLCRPETCEFVVPGDVPGDTTGQARPGQAVTQDQKNAPRKNK